MALSLCLVVARQEGQLADVLSAPLSHDQDPLFEPLKEHLLLASALPR